MRTDRYIQEPTQNKKGRRILSILIAVILILAMAIACIVFYSYRSAEESLSLSFDYTPQGINTENVDIENVKDVPLAMTGNKDSDTNAQSADSDTKNAQADQEILYVEIGGDYAADELVAASSGEVKPATAFLNTDSLGERELEYTVSTSLYGGLLNPSKEYTLKYSVIDTEPPLVLWNGSGTALQRGTEFDINNVFSYGDNADPRPDIKVDGDVDMKTAGRYSMHITLTDASGNRTEDDLYVDVVDTLPTYPASDDHTEFKDFARKYRGKGRTFGIDVSTWQRDIDFEKVRKAGCDFVMIRVGYSDDGTLTEDSYFRKNLKKAKAAGLKVGLYMYSYDNSEEEVLRAARTVIDTLSRELGDEKLDLPIAFDWEDFGRFQQYEMSLNDLNGLYDAFAEELKTAGYDCMLYSSKNYLEKVWTDTDKRPIWLAHYTDKTDYEGPYAMWQASCIGRINGITGDVDLDILYE